MKQKYGIFTISKQSSGYGNMYVIADANGATYKSIYHAQDDMIRLNGLQKTNPFSRFFGSSGTNYTILPIYEESAGFGFGFPFQPPQQQQEPQSQYFKKVNYGVFKIATGSDNKYVISNVSGSNPILFTSMSDAYDYVKNIPNISLTTGENDFVILPIYKYIKPY